MGEQLCEAGKKKKCTNLSVVRVTVGPTRERESMDIHGMGSRKERIVGYRIRSGSGSRGEVLLHKRISNREVLGRAVVAGGGGWSHCNAPWLNPNLEQRR